MTVVTGTIQLKTNPPAEEYHTHIIDITPQVAEHLAQANIGSGIVTLFIAGSTAAVTTIEFEPGLLADFQRMWGRTVPKDAHYDHDSAWGESNGYAHVRASLLGASLVVPFRGKKLMLGTWQQIVVVDFDIRPRSRQVIVQIMGE